MNDRKTGQARSPDGLLHGEMLRKRHFYAIVYTSVRSRIAIAPLAGLDLANDYVDIERYLDWGVRQLTEVAEMMIGMTLFLFVWLNARRLANDRSRDSTAARIIR